MKRLKFGQNRFPSAWDESFIPRLCWSREQWLPAYKHIGTGRASTITGSACRERCSKAGALGCFWMSLSCAIDGTVVLCHEVSQLPHLHQRVQLYNPTPALMHSSGWLCGQGSLWLGTEHSFNKEYCDIWHTVLSVSWMLYNSFPIHRKRLNNWSHKISWSS